MRCLALASLTLPFLLAACGSAHSGAASERSPNTLKPVAESALHQVVRGSERRGCRLIEPISLGVASPGALLDVQFVSPAAGWMVGSGRILVTTDGGSHWSVQATSPTAQWSALDFVDASHGWVVGADGLLATSDGGRHWRELPEHCPAIRTLDFLSPERGFAIAGGVAGGGGGLGSVVRTVYSGSDRRSREAGLLVSDDGGKSWRRLLTPKPPQSVCFNSSEHGWLGAGGNIYATSDGGRHWTLSYKTPPRRQPETDDPAAVALRCAGAHAAWAEVVPPGAGSSQAPHIGLHSSGGSWEAIFAEQYFPHPGIAVSRQSPGSYPSAFSAISGSTAAFIDFCPACVPQASTPVGIAEKGGLRFRRPENVHGLTQAFAASFISPNEGWVAGVLENFHQPCSATECRTPKASFRLEHTTNGGRTWHTQYSHRGNAQ